MKRFASIVMMSGLAFVAIAAAAQPPVRDISGKRHPNLARAQHQTDAAYQSIVAAQQANEFDLGGHAQKAKELLDQANRELKQAAEVSNANH
jgi:F0F1-type ATP synthase membrane subunit b/b'